MFSLRYKFAFSCTFRGTCVACGIIAVFNLANLGVRSCFRYVTNLHSLARLGVLVSLFSRSKSAANKRKTLILNSINLINLST